MGHNVNPNQVWVPGYTRADGTVVKGYWRTVPNNTTSDNRRHGR